MRLFILISKFFVGLVICIIAAELVLSLFPVATGFQRDTKPFPIRHWKPKTEYVWSNGWNFRNPQKGWTNNYGFSNVKDYKPKQAQVLLIGDSYFEAQQVSRGNTIEDVIQKETKSETYTIAVSGSTLPDYIKYLEYGVNEFDPKKIILKLYDFDLLVAFGTDYPMGSYFTETEDSFILHTTEPNLANFKFKNFMKKSSLLRYLFINLKIVERLKSFLSFSKKESTPQKDIKSLLQKLPKYLQYEFKRIQIDPNSVLIMTNSDLFVTELEASGFHAVNIEKHLEKVEQNTKFKMNFAPYDYHWNFRGHYKAGKVLSKELLQL